MKTLLLVDGNAIMHRAYHALPPFKTSSGIPTNVLYGFISVLHKAIVDYKPNSLVICFDTPKETFRNKLFKQYQIQRPKIDDEFITQIPLVKEALDKAGIIRLEKDGYEADDVIGTVANKFVKSNIRVLILTGDKDIMQLVNNHISVVTPQIGFSQAKIYDAQEVKKKFNISPTEIPDFLGLMGDPSDNYPGAKGIGPKTAAQLIEQFGNIDYLYSHLDQVKNQRIRNILEENKKNVMLSKQLATIVTNVNIDIFIDKCEFNWFKPELKDYLKKYEIKTLTERIFKEKKPETAQPTKPKNNSENQIGLF